ncbi:PhzF family phenazine biosynthesis protein [Erysipelotrichaceae bacterium OttesenSCG-928-M19]|nr:PhzF family phenazine biosynthesis protein [Erysipelotrichaceae bacterium OttesenSCG-928-M19]
MRAFEVSAFTKDGAGGNLAGVVVMDNLLSDSDKQAIAKKYGYSETAFIEVFEDNNFNVSFFTPTEEVDLCGHATIATFHVLKENGYINKEVAYQYTKAGKLKVLCNEKNVLMEMSKPIIHEDLDKVECAEILGIESEKIVNIPKKIAVGLPDAMVIVNSNETLKNLKVDFSRMIAYSNKHQMTGFHVCSIEKNKYYTRNFGPAVGIDEESATGTASGSMYVYLQNKGYIKGNEEIHFLQGDIMDLPSEIVVKLEDETIWVGGQATIIKQLSI